MGLLGFLRRGRGSSGAATVNLGDEDSGGPAWEHVPDKDAVPLPPLPPLTPRPPRPAKPPPRTHDDRDVIRYPPNMTSNNVG